MKKKNLESLHWLLQHTKRTLRIPEQKNKWNEIASDFRKNNVGLNKVKDSLGELLSETESKQD